ncbi:MAG: 50S ribosomal protein L15 [Dehalococcoidia bacterium]|nr:50S ribosomal protein L15 [Dehalococcoidia bacterium]
MKQHEIAPPSGARKKAKRVGRGPGSGHGTYAGRGCKGNKARAGFSVRPGFEGGQLPIIKRLPEKRGFVNLFTTRYSVVNLSQLNVFENGTEVTAETLRAAGLIKSVKDQVKVLGTGALERQLTVKVNRFSAAAKEKIEAAGGKIEEVAYAAEGG